MKRLLTLLAAAAVCAPLAAVVPHKAALPDIPGYKTLKGDFHVHTMFSDGTVWPVERVKEAEYEGLDFFSMTDHMEPRHRKQVQAGILDGANVNKNTSYEIAAKYAQNRGVTVIHGAEMSRGTNNQFPGHFNTHFISDADAISDVCEEAAAKARESAPKNASPEEVKVRGEMAALKAGLKYAREEQNAFIVWNHPQWQRQAHNGVKWGEIQEWAWKNGCMQGIEIVNHDCSDMLDRKAFHWAMEKGLAVISGTDAHGPMFEIVDAPNQEYRAMTLIFATENTPEGIREALDNGRSAVFADRHLYGPEKYLAEMFKAILEISSITVSKDRLLVRVQNNSSIPLEFSKREDTHPEVYMNLNPFRLNRGEETTLVFRTSDEGPMPESITVDIIVHNFWCDVDVPVQLEMTFTAKK